MKHHGTNRKFLVRKWFLRDKEIYCNWKYLIGVHQIIKIFNWWAPNALVRTNWLFELFGGHQIIINWCPSSYLVRTNKYLQLKFILLKCPSRSSVNLCPDTDSKVFFLWNRTELWIYKSTKAYVYNLECRPILINMCLCLRYYSITD